MQYKMSDRIMPNQDPLLEYYKEDRESLSSRIFETCIKYSKIENKDSSFKYHKNFPEQQYMGTDPIVRKFQSMLIGQIQAKKVLEIGTFVGMGTINLAKSVGESGSVTTIEKFSEFANIARENFKQAGLGNITLLEGDAFNIIQDLTSAGGGDLYDFIFLDGNKEHYFDYFNMLFPYLKVGGILMIDDGFFVGDILNDEPQTQKGKGVKKFLESIIKKDDADSLLLPLGAGSCIITKLRS